MASEVWLDIPGFEEYYQASNFGNVRSLERTIETIHGHQIKMESVVLKQWVVDKVCVVSLSKNNVPVDFQVHRIVCKLFVKNRNNFYWIRHADNNMANNSASNLVWSLKRPVRSKVINSSELL